LVDQEVDGLEGVGNALGVLGESVEAGLDVLEKLWKSFVKI
jgi:hypothetical protein